MRKILLSLFFLFGSLFNTANVSAQTVYFQRFPAGAVSSVSALGPAITLIDLAGGLSNARLGGVDANGAGLVFYSDRGADQIFAVDTTSNIYNVVLPFSGLSSPQAVSLDITGNFLYIADAGNGRIVRVNLSLPLPTNKVQIVVDASAAVTGLVSDVKYNSSDGYLYWVNDGTLHRAAVKGQPMPVPSGETLITKNSINVTHIDFDLGSPQTIYFSSGSGGFEGIYSSPIPRIGDTPNLDEVRILDNSLSPDITITGVAVDKNSPYFCYTATSTPPAPVMRCGDRTTTSVGNFPPLLDSQFSVAPSFFVIDSPSNVVAPVTKLSAPILQLDLSLKKPAVKILLKEFDEAVVKAARGVISRATSGKIDFRYVVDINKIKDAGGKPVSESKRDIRKMISKRNELTAKNLKTNSTYEVRYSIEITQKKKGEPEEVVKKTKISPTSSFLIQ